MDILSPSANKYDFDGIGAASASVVFALMAANPATAWLTVGLIPGKIVYYLLSRVFGKFASQGVVILNVGAEKVLVASEKSQFDGTMESSYRLIAEIQATGRDLTDEEMKAIDGPVIEVFRKFARLTRGKKKKKEKDDE